MNKSAAEVPESLNLKVKWPRDVIPSPEFANLFVVYKQPGGEIIVTFAQTAPLLVGTGAEQYEQARKMIAEGGSEARYVSRIVMTEKVASELLNVLAKQLQKPTGEPK